MKERYLSVREFTELLGVSRSNRISWIKNNRVVAYSVHGRWRTMQQGREDPKVV
jgi:hypothetical protein